MHRCQYVSVLVRDRAVRGAAACALIAGLTVAASPSVARAEGGAGPAPVVAEITTPLAALSSSVDGVGDVVDPTAVASGALDGVLGEDPEEAATTVDGGSVANDAPVSPPSGAASVQAPAPVSPPSGEASVQAPAPATPPSGETSVQAPAGADTTPSDPDTTPDTASQRPPEPTVKDTVAAAKDTVAAATARDVVP